MLAHWKLSTSKYHHYKISEIAHSTDFRDVTDFARAFRRRFGVTPSEAERIVLDYEERAGRVAPPMVGGESSDAVRHERA